MTKSPYIFTAHDYWAHLQQHGKQPTHPAPHSIILALYGAGPSRWRKRFWHKTVSGFTAEILLYREAGWQVGRASRFGVGGPAIAGLMEMLAVWGVKQFILLGSAGSLQPHIQAGDIILPTTALGEDGVSHLYPPSSQPSVLNSQSAHLNAQIHPIVHKIGPTHTGKVWSTAAPFRETKQEAKQHQEADVLAVDMETAALFAVGHALNVATTAVLVASDSLANGRWLPTSQPDTIRDTLAHIEHQLIHTLCN